MLSAWGRWAQRLLSRKAPLESHASSGRMPKGACARAVMASRCFSWESARWETLGLDPGKWLDALQGGRRKEKDRKVAIDTERAGPSVSADRTVRSRDRLEPLPAMQPHP